MEPTVLAESCATRRAILIFYASVSKSPSKTYNCSMILGSSTRPNQEPPGQFSTEALARYVMHRSEFVGPKPLPLGSLLLVASR